MKIGIVNDMPMAVEALRRILALVPQHEVIWAALNGADAIKFCAKQKPDLLLMDLIMPELNGVEATRRIMASTPCAILLVTASVEENSAQVFEAMGYGALNAVDMPSLGPGDIEEAAAPLLAKIKMIERFVGNGWPRNRLPHKETFSPSARQRLVVFGASAGGPAALATVLAALPKEFSAAIVIVQHIDEKFTPHMAKWLNRQSALPVRLAEEGDTPVAGTALLAATGNHLIFRTADRLGYTQEPVQHIYKPSIDVFFQSVSRRWAGEAAGVLLTGMGRDGAAGLKMLRRKGCYTITQDKASSAVYGMPKAAAALDAATDILPLDLIAPRLVEHFASGYRNGG